MTTDQEYEPVCEAVKGAISTWREANRGLRGPMRLAELALQAQSLAMAISVLPGDPETSSPRKEPVSCRKGCGACCRQVVPLSPPEAFLLAEMAQAVPPDERDVLLERFFSLAERLESTGLRDALFNSTAEYFRLGLACPFLVEESCSIHAMRPLVCREHLVVSPADLCASFPNAFIRLQRIPVSVGEALSELAAECMVTGQEMLPLVRVFQWVAGQSELGERTWEAEWLLDRLAARCLRRLDYSAAPERITASTI